MNAVQSRLETGIKGTAKHSVSVALATYNGARYLREQLDSLATQTYLPTELVVTDDGSSDETLAVLAQFAAIAPFPVHVYRNPERLGYRANFMRAVGLCSGSLISFCDQDDVWRPENLERVVAGFDDPEVLLVFHNALLVKADRQPISSFYAAPPLVGCAPTLTLNPWMFAWGFMQTFRADLKNAMPEWRQAQCHLFPGEVLGHDMFFFLLAASLGKVHYVDEMLTEYRQHDNNTVGSKKRTAPTLIERWRYRFEDRSETYGHLAHIATINADLLDQLSHSDAMPEVLRSAAGHASRAWLPIARLYEGRARCCRGSAIGRLAAFLRLWRAGFYGESSFWTLGRSAMMKDFVLGVVAAPLILRIGARSSLTDRTCRRGRNTLGQSLSMAGR